MSKVIFKYKGNSITIQCEYNEKVSKLLEKYMNKGKTDMLTQVQHHFSFL